MARKRLGRPKGSKNAVDVVVVERSHCPKCGSARRSEYWGRLEQKCPGLRADGTSYTAIIRRRPATARLWPCQGAGASTAARCGSTRSTCNARHHPPETARATDVDFRIKADRAVSDQLHALVTQYPATAASKK
jgi:hypothetical protein